MRSAVTLFGLVAALLLVATPAPVAADGRGPVASCVLETCGG